MFLFYFICGHIPLLVIRADYCLNRCRVLGLSDHKKTHGKPKLVGFQNRFA